MPNPYAQFLKLIPTRRQVIGKVTSVDATNKTSSVLLLDGGTVTVKGQGTVDSYYLIDDGVIQQELPSLTQYSISIA